MVFLALATMFTLGCGDRTPTLPSGPPQASAAALVDPVVLEGCGRLRIAIRGRDSVSVVEMEGACGPIRPRLAGRPTFDRVRQVVKLPLAIENGSERNVRPPAFVYAWSDSLRVLSPPGLGQNRHAPGYLSFTGADSVTAPTDADLPDAAIWRFDTLLARLAESAQTLAPGERSRPRPVEIDVKQGASDFLLVLGARARRATAPVPAQAPDTVPAWVEAPENRAYLPAFHTTVLKNIIIVSFVPGTPQAKRQEAIDLVDGEVVGGQPDPFGIEGDYYVRVDDDGTGRDLLRKEVLLRALPQVRFTILGLGLPVGEEPERLPTPEQVRRGPTFMPYTVAPELVNRDEIRAALVREYPPELKGAGVGDTVLIWLLLNESGTPLQARIKRGSGHAALDSAALRVGRIMRFTPARNRGKPVEVWMVAPVTFGSAERPAPPPRSGAQSPPDTRAEGAPPPPPARSPRPGGRQANGAAVAR